MRSRVWLNIGLLAAVAVLGIVAFIRPGQEEIAERPSITALVPAQLGQLHLERSDQKSLDFIKDSDSGRWYLEPSRVAAAPSQMDSILDILQAESKSRVETKGRNLSEFGLKDPQIRLRADEVSLVFGDRHPIEAQRYVQVGEAVHLVAERDFRPLKREWTAFVNQALLPPGAQVSRLKLPEATLSRSEEGTWEAQSQPGSSAKTLQKTIDAWQQGSAFRVSPYEEGSASDSEGGAIALELKGRSEPLRFKVVKREPELVLARPELGLQYHLIKRKADELLRVGSKTQKEDKPTPQEAPQGEDAKASGGASD